MTREDLEKMINPTFAWDLLGESGSPEEGRKELEDAMVAAYNKGIEDAVGKYISDREFLTNSEWDSLCKAKNLKIK